MTLSLICYSKCQPCHVERSETSFTLFLPLSFRPSEASGEIWYVERGTVVGIYGLRRLQSGAAGSSTLKGSPRAWLLPFMFSRDVTADVIRENGLLGVIRERVPFTDDRRVLGMTKEHFIQNHHHFVQFVLLVCLSVNKMLPLG